MTATTHAMVGATVAILLKDHPEVGLPAALLSHYLLDAIPHWHYGLRSIRHDPNAELGFKMEINKALFKDLLPVGIDCLIAFTLVNLAILGAPTKYFLLAYAGAALGALPDFMQVVFYLLKNKAIMKYHQIFHRWIHARTRLDDRPWIGIASQIILVFLSLALLIRSS